MAKEAKRAEDSWLQRLVRNDAQGIILVVAIWIFIGSLNIYSATSVEMAQQGTILKSNIVKHIGFLILSLMAGSYFYHLDYRRLKEPKFIMWIMVAVLLSLVWVGFFGTVVNGARRWISLPFGLSVQPSEFAKLAGVIWAAQCIEEWRKRFPTVSLFESREANGQPRKYPVPAKALWAPLAFGIITLVQPDTGTAVLIVGFPLILMVMARLNRRSLRQLGGVMIVGLIGFAAMIWHSPYRLERILAWLDPWGHAQTLSYQSVQSMLAIGSGGIFGQGLGEGTAKYFYLPEAHTDFAFAVWAQETGLLGAAILSLVVLAFVYFGFRVAIDARDFFGKLMALGITCIIGGQAVFNMLMVCGMLPVTGVPLPFVSYGGSSLLMNVVAVAILLSISRTNEEAKRKIGSQGVMPSLREETRSRFRPSNG